MIPILADAGVPMIMLVFPAAFLMIVPIVAIEAWVAGRCLATIHWRFDRKRGIDNCGLAFDLGDFGSDTAFCDSWRK